MAGAPRIISTSVATRLLVALALAASLVVVGTLARPEGTATAIPPQETYYTLMDAELVRTSLETSHAVPADCCALPETMHVITSILSAVNGNVIYYDHYEDGYEADPYAPVQSTTLTLNLDAGDVWIMDDDIPLPRVATDIHFDGRDRISSSDAIAVTQAAWSADEGTVHAIASQVFELEDYGTAFRVPIGENADYNQMFEYVGLLITAQADGTIVEIDNNGDGITDTTSPTLSAGQVYLVNGGVNLGAAVTSNSPISVHVQSGDHDPNVGFEGRLMELYPTASWSAQYISPVSSIGANQTRVFLFNPSDTAITVTPTTTTGTVAPISVPANGQASYLMPNGQGASFASSDVFYAVQAVTSEGNNTSSYDWGFTLVPFDSLTTAVIVPLGYGMAKNGAGTIAENLSPVWVAAAAATTLYVDLDGDPSTGALVDPSSNQYDFSCTVTAYQVVTIYDDGTNACRAPDSAQPAGGDRDMTRARIYTVDGVEIAAAWGQRPGYDAINGLDFGTTVFPAPVPEIAVTKTAGVTSIAEPGGMVTFTVAVTNVGSETVSFETLVDSDYGDLLDPSNPQVSNNTCLTPTAPFNLIVDQTFTCSFDAYVAGTFGGPDHENTVVAGANGGTLTASGTATATITFTPRPATVSGQVLDDFGNPIAGVTITATDSTGAITTTTTAADGTYTLTLTPETYTITETQPAGYGDGGESAGTSGGTVSDDTISGVVLVSDDVVTGVDFTETTGSIAGVVYDDKNGNGSLDAGEALSGVTVTLSGSDVNGAITPVPAVTDANGAYRFDGLLAGDYTLVESQPSGYSDGADFVGSTGGTLVPPDTIDVITLAAGEDATDYDFTEFVGASIAGSVVDDGSPVPSGIAGVTVELYDAGGLVASTTTDGNGDYSFTGLAPGTYTVVESQPAGYGDGADSAGTSAGDATSVNDEVSGIVLTSGDAVTGVDFAETTGSIAGVVYDDANGDGSLDAGESGIANVTVVLYDDAGGFVASTTTGADGSYSFDGLLAGTYSVVETQPAGYTDGAETAGTAGGTLVAPDSIESIVLAPGEDATGYLFGEYVGASISGSVVDDSPVPSGISGVTVTLYDDLGLEVASTTTDANGDYSFTGLAPGTYRVVESQPAAYGDGADSPGDSGGDASSVNDEVSGIVLVSGDAVTGVDFAETTGSISGTVEDEAGDPIAGVEITLSGTDVDGRPVSATTFTLADGSYTFDYLPAGTYTIVETQPAAYGDGPDTAGNANGTVDSATDTISGITLAVDQDATGYDFVETLGSISGHVFIDADDDGQYTAGVDVPLGGVQVTLTGTDPNGAITPITIMANTDGSYVFDGLLAGTYTVTETQPLGYADGSDSDGSSGGTLANDEVSAIPLAAGVDATGYDFGELPPGAISGSVLDENGDPIEGVEIVLTGTDANDAAVLLSTTTGTDGSYTFSGLLPGEYTVTETQPVGYGDVSTTAGSLGGDDSVENVISGIVLGVDPLADTISTGNDFVEGYGSISGVVYDDANGNGSLDAGEALSGVTVTLSGSDVNGAITPVPAVTDANGAYRFDGLLSGTYSVTESQPAGYSDGVDYVGSAGGSLVAPDSIESIVLDPAEDATGYDFTEFVPSSISGSVVDDLGRPIAGVTVELYDAGGLVASTTTDVNGDYSFTGLAPGTYRVVESQPAAYGDGVDSAGDSGGDASSVNDQVSGIVLVSGTAVTGVDFAETTGSISGVVYDDANGDGVLDVGESGIENVTVELYDAGGLVASTTTGVDGSYNFDGLLAGTYSVVESQPAGYADGAETAGSAGGTLVAPDSITVIELDPAEDATGYLFGEYRTTSITASVVDENLVAIAGVTVTLLDEGGNPIATDTTDVNGEVAFTGLAPGTYALVETQPPGYGEGGQTSTWPGADATVTNEISNIVVASGDTSTGNVFTETYGSISGVVYDDANGNGSLDSGEALSGVTVELYDAGGLVASTTTGTDGSYRFDGLLSRDYTLVELQPTGYSDGADFVGSTGGTLVAPDSIEAITLAAGEDATDYDFTEFIPSSISGSVVDDLGNPIAGATVTLYDDLDAVVAVTTTNGAGDYSFTGLEPGTYTVVETQPIGYGDGPDSAGNSGGDTSVNDEVSGIVLVSDTTVTGVDFVETTGSIAGSVEDEAGGPIAGVQLTLTGTSSLGNPVSLTTTTLADGTYVFDGVPAGDYTLVETQPSAYGDGPDSAGDAGGTVDSPSDTITDIALATDQDAVGYDFVETLGSISGYVFIDADGDGVYTAGVDVPLSGVDVTLTGTDPNGTITPQTVPTAADGSYVFDGLLAGDYTVTETQPAGWVDGLDSVGSEGGTLADDEISDIPLAGGVDATVYSFGEQPAGSISGSVLDEYDAPIVGVEIVLTGTDVNDAAVVRSTTTGADGSYSFSGLLPGTYTVTETQPAGYGDVSTTAGSLGGDDSVQNAISGIVLGVEPPTDTISTGNDFVEGFATLSGTVFDDLDGDGVQDLDEPGIAGVSLSLSGTDAATNTVTRTATTGVDGSYTFVDLLAGTYTVTETQPAGYLDGTDSAGTAGGTAANPGDAISGIGLPAGVDATDYDFAEFDAASVSGSVVDEHLDPIAGVTIELSDTDGFVGSTTTAADGTYSFEGLEPGTYTVVETQPAGYGEGGQTSVWPGTDATVTNEISNILLASGDDATGNVFTETYSILSGTVFVDLDNDGVRDPGESGIAGVSVSLSGADAATNPVTASATTAADGSYSFPDLLAGTYTVTESQPSGYLDGADAAGSAGGTAADPGDAISAVPLSAGTDATGYTFGEIPASSLSGSVTDENGLPIAGVSITLTGLDDLDQPVSLVTSTGADGTYSFDDLRPGTYTLTETQPAAYGDLSTTAGSAGGDDSVQNVVSAIDLGVGVDATGYAFVESLGSISGVVYDDLDDDGVRDLGEPGIDGVTVELSDAGGVIATTVTASGGTYTFDDLLAGTYTVTESQPSGYLDGTDAAGSAGGTATNPGDTISGIGLAGGEDATGYLFGEVVSASISGAATDENGLPLAGVEITLTGLDDLGQSVTLTTSTASDGTYSFDGLRPGTYAVVETQPAGYGDGSQTSDDTDAVTSTTNVISNLVLEPGETNENNDFVDTLGSISGVVFDDYDNDGVQDPGEPGISGVSVSLTGTDVYDVAVAATATTDGSGVYVFDDLVGGAYTVTETQPSDYLDGTDAAGSAGGSATNPGDAISAIGLTGGEDATGYLFGELQASTISGTVEETDGAPIAGVELTLAGLDDLGQSVTLTATTAADGTYSFDGLRPGTYAVTETQPIAFGDVEQTSDDPAADLTVANEISNLVVEPGETSTGNTFVEERATLSGHVFLDVDDDGVYTAGVDSPLAGETVTLTGVDVLDDPVGPVTATTDGNGLFVFVDLLAGTYRLDETAPVGWVDGTDSAGSEGGTVLNDSITDIVLGGGVDGTDYAFGERPPFGITGRVSARADDGGLGPIAGVTILLAGTDLNDQPVSDSTVTDALGDYRFDSLLPGTYTVTELQPSGYGEDTTSGGPFGTPDDSVTNVISSIDIAADTAVVDYSGNEFVESYSTLSGVVFVDLDNDGVQDPGEPGLAGVEVTLTGTDVNGAIAPVTVTTGADGSYTFVDLLSGTYTVTETQPAGYADGADTAGSAGGTAANPGDAIDSIPLGAGIDATGYTFAELGAPLGGIVWIDDDRDGVPDADEPGIPGVTITLLDSDGNVVATTTTDGTGSYVFGDLTAGNYTIVQTQPDGYGSTTPSTLDVTLTSTGLTDADFGEDLGSIGDTVWADLDDDGIFDVGEPGVAGVTVRLVDGDGVLIATTVTDSTGSYEFTRLPVGIYGIEIEVPADLALTAPGQGPADVDSDPDRLTGATDPITIGVVGGDPATGLLSRRTDIDAGLVVPAIDLAITGSVPATPVRPGDSVTFTYDSTNNSNVPVLDGARVVVEFPVGLVPTRVTAPGWTVVISGQNVTLIRDEILLPGEQLPTFTIDATVSTSTPELIVDARIGTLDSSTEITFANNDSVLGITVTVPDLPSTGSTPWSIIRVALMSILVGLVLAGSGRRRRSATA